MIVAANMFSKALSASLHASPKDCVPPQSGLYFSPPNRFDRSNHDGRTELVT